MSHFKELTTRSEQDCDYVGLFSMSLFSIIKVEKYLKQIKNFGIPRSTDIFTNGLKYAAYEVNFYSLIVTRHYITRQLG